VALEVTTRFALVVLLGARTMASAAQMLGRVAGCCGRELPLLLIDSHRPYPAAILQVFGQVLHRRRRKGHGRGRRKHKRLKPPPGLLVGVVQKVRDATGNLLGVRTRALFGRLKAVRRRIQKHKLGVGINTAHVERWNGTARGRLARLARKTRDMSRRSVPLAAALRLWRDVYNWVHPHSALEGATPAMASGLTNEVWTMRRYVKYPVHLADWQQAIWAEEQEKRVTSALHAEKELKPLPTS
jgi:hypothetical protein